MTKRFLYLISPAILSITFLFSCGGDDDNGPSGPVPVIESFSPQKGLAEMMVTITGENFSAVSAENEVSFNGKVASIISSSSTEIVVKTPVDATTGKIAVKSKGVGSVSDEDFTIVPNPWTKQSDFPGGERSNAIGFAIGTKGYVGFGVDGYDHFKDLWSYTPETDTWTRVADFPGEARSYGVAFVIGAKAYVGLGVDDYNLAFKDLWEYDPSTNAWTRKADFPAVGREGAISFAIGNKAYVGTGGGSYEYADFWEYDPANNTWQQKADFAGGKRSGATGFSLGNKGYICTGINDLERMNDLWEYDPATNAWTKKSDLPGVVRFDAVSFVIDNNAYVGTGIYFTGVQRDLYKYDASADTWEREIDLTGSPDLSQGNRGSAVAFAVGNKGYVGPGFYYGIAYKTTEVWGFTVN